MAKTQDVTIYDEDADNSMKIENDGSTNSNAKQSGDWDIKDITGTVSLPTGASTLAAQALQTDELELIKENQTDKTQMTQITDGDHEAAVTPNNRLKVEANISALPATPVEYNIVFLENNGSREMDVNGSNTPVVFDWEPPSNETWYIEKIVFVISDTGSSDPGDYGSISGGISNGCLLEVQSNGSVEELGIIKDNLEVVETFSNDSFSGDGNFLGSSNTYKGAIHFDNPFILLGNLSDFVKLTVRDNITGLNFQRISVRIWREQA